MGFDNECILNIQSLAGEYFCPVCRLLVYPNEALQSQCTHLYCKPCLAYVATTTRACPYDGYLVTQADSKPLIESNKVLAETIGKINVHCLYHRSGCSWQGPLLECTSHCSGCAFGNSPVVCNRCGVQIVHRQVQEHAQSCSGVQPQAHAGGAHDATATSTTVAAEQNQAVSEAGTATALAQPPQTSTSSVPVVESSQQANSTTQSHSTVQTALPTAEQWYQQQQQQQQQYQQYYQQYPGYDPYQQHYQQYYPYQQQAVPQQSQALMQPQPQVPSQTQPQPHLQIQLPVVAQPQTNPQVNPQQQTLSTPQPQSQIQLQTHPPSHGQPPLQVQPHQQTNPVQHHPQQIQMPQYQQLHSQMQQPQPQVPTQAQSQLYPQHPAQGLSQTHAQHPMQPVQQPFTSQPSQPTNPHLQAQPSSAYAVTGHQSYPQQQSQHQAQLGGPQHSLPYPQGGSHPQFPQQSPLLRASQSHTPIQNPHQSGFLPSQGQVLNVPPHQQPVHSHSHPPGMSVPQRPAMPSVQQPIHQQYLQQQQQQSFTGQGAYVMQHLHGHSQSRPQAPSNAHQQPLQNVGSPQGIQPHQYQAQTFAARPNVPPYGVPTYPHSSTGMQIRPTLVGAEQQSGNSFRTSNQPQLSSEQHLSAKATSERQGDQIVERISEADTSSQKNVRDLNAAIGRGADAVEVKAVKSESDLKDIDNDSSKSTYEGKDVSQSFGGENLLKNVEEPKEGVDDHKDVSKTNHDSEDKGVKDGSLVNNLHGKMQSDSVLMVDQGKQLPPLVPHQPKAIGSSLPEPPPGSLHHMPLPGHPSAPVRPLGPGHMLPGPEIPPAGVAGLGSTPVTVRGSHYGPQVPYSQGHSLPPYGEQTPYNYTDGRRLDPLGQQSNMHPSAMRMNGAPGMDSSMALGLRDDRSKPFFDDRAGLYPHDPSRWIGERKEFEDLKHFPRPSDLDSESAKKFGDNFTPSRPFDRGPLDKGFPVPNYDPGMKLEPPGLPAPSRFFRPYHHDGFYDNTVGRPADFARAHPDFSGPVRRYDRRHAPRSPGRDYRGVSPHRFGAIHGPDDADGRESYRFGDSFHSTRFPVLPSHLHMGEFDGPGQDGFPNHFGRGGRLGEPIGFGAFRGPAGMGDLSGRGNFFRPRPGEPGFRSSFSVKGFPGDGVNYTDELDHFDNPRRKSYSMGWCRICRVDCETVEGLDLHSQTREHQKKAMDMVLTIKQNAKKQKLATSDRSSLDDASKPRNANIDSHGNKN